MKKKLLYIQGIILLLGFVVWTFCVLKCDVQINPITNTPIGLASINLAFHKWSGIHLALYEWSDLLSMIPFMTCIGFGCLGLVQWIERKNIFKVDVELFVLGIYYMIVIACYSYFEVCPINYRPIFIEGCLEASYPSSTTLLILSVMPTLSLYIDQKLQDSKFKTILKWMISLYSFGMVLVRLLSGVHWLTDIIGAILFSTGLLQLYKAIIE